MHITKWALAGVLSAVLAGPALANPLAIAGVEAVTTAVAQSEATSGSVSNGTGIGEGGTGVGQGGSSSGSVSNHTGDTNAIGAALSQSESALSVEGVCGKDNRFAFGLLQWSDYSSKCFNYQMAILAALSRDIPADQRWTLANQWVERADQQ